MATLKPRRRKQEQRREQSEQKLIDALITIINRDGVNAVTCDTVSEIANCSRSLVALRLGKRDEMFAKLVHHLQAERSKTFEALISGHSSQADILKAFVDNHFDGIRDDPGYRAYFILLAGTLTDRPLLRDVVAQAHEALRHWFERALNKGIESKEFPQDLDVEHASTRIGSFLLGVSLYFQLYPDQSASLEKLRQDAYECLP